ncbi:MAG: RNA 2',3'-cyclic phosphodiesterase [Candidatus Accumulibacter sp.]|jgi:2'-5' RNA ligase|nr:RNA 2',3'-cyclic phosphodiesterase [Accumulibacter sp.]
MDRQTPFSGCRREENRLFVALETPNEIRESLCGLRFRFPGLKWTPPGQLHLTLRFIGPVSPEKMGAVQHALSGVRHASFHLTVAGLGLFSRKTGGILWAGVNDEPALRELKRRVDEAIHDATGSSLEEASFSPHFTLSRLKGASPPTLKIQAREASEEMFGEMRASAFTLFRSHLRPSGAIHEAVERYSFTPEK